MTKALVNLVKDSDKAFLKPRLSCKLKINPKLRVEGGPSVRHAIDEQAHRNVPPDLFSET